MAVVKRWRPIKAGRADEPPAKRPLGARTTVRDGVGALAIITLAWWLLSLTEPSFLLPSPWTVLPEIPNKLLNGSLAAQLVRSLARLAVGYAAGVAARLTSVAIAALVPVVRRLLFALVGMLQAVPPIAFMPLLVLLLGFGNAPVAVVVAVATFYPLAIGAQAALAHLEGSYLEVARALAAPAGLRFRRVTLPAILPELLGAARIGFGNAWRGLVAAEMIGGAGHGIGWDISQRAQVGDMAGLLSGIVVVGLVAALIDGYLFGTLERALRRTRESGAHP